ncbi:phosphoribulokinase [Methanoplanus endosymbiosus]|uniref:phosphoribulokinase n=1 Tax=Methanoplanus endosymbiosus TaxID=33865 RepID=A0A9E7PNJ7_9EURY|nr:phosphoribulokinase [Methanoplanus endosymbiosus]UUX93559.1 phosphoribulokinase [Methanoplanus endosymbiosus]
MSERKFTNRVSGDGKYCPPSSGNVKNLKEIIEDSGLIFIIGVSGDSGSGKTTFTDAIREIFGPSLVSTITLDDYHILDREERREMNITPLHPDANNFRILEEHLSDLKSGKEILKPVYNHKTGKFDEPVLFSSSKILIIEGLHAFATPELRRLTDFSIYVNPDTNVKYGWKIERDVNVRGYDKEDVLSELEARRRDYESFVLPQSEYADALIEISDSSFNDLSLTDRGVYRITLHQKRLDKTVKNICLNFDLFAINSLADRDFGFDFRVTERDGEKIGALSLDGEFQYDVIRCLELNIEEQTGVSPVSLFEGRDYVTATEMIQLLLSWRIINRRIQMES